ncbi:ComEC/Rec2 family competence protein [Pelagicoccus albus]|uniref:ComEC/Rec2 family competence protein n=1 Tax=Pelagicoccus albus TaxID=415222 RepID=A0A7X1B5F8_9BACT|nr:ComEC/Rec2 family competence protein [Pelagicoccus albus]MBC2605965.1 ComEC/Rec2 family competence protein [Pelagicoccus albus]
MSAAESPRRVPLLWILIPLSLGIGLARFFPSTDLLGLGLLAATLLGFAYWSLARAEGLWVPCFALSICLLGYIRFMSSIEDDTGNSLTIPREAAMQIKIEQLFNATDPGTALGLATIEVPSRHLAQLKSDRIFFFLETKDLNEYPQEGQTFSCVGVIRPLRQYREGDRFDAYLRNQGITLAYKQGYLLEQSQRAHGFKRAINKTRFRLSEILIQNKAPESDLTRAYQGLMLGQKSALTPEQKQLFLQNGAMHLFAISGLHIGVIALCFHQLLSLLQIKDAPRAIASLAGVCAFVVVTGGSASSWRALLMVACFYLSNFGRKQPSPLNALAASALIYLLLLPGQLFQAGFQMSYITVSSILLLGLPLAKTLNSLTPMYQSIPPALLNKRQKATVVVKRWILDALGVSIAAFLVSAILGIYYFQILPSYGILINLIALPLASLAIVAGFLSILTYPMEIIFPVFQLFNDAALVLIKLIHLVLTGTSKLPNSSIITPAEPAWLISVALLSSLFLIGYSYSRLGKPGVRLWQIASVIYPSIWIIKLGS